MPRSYYVKYFNLCRLRCTLSKLDRGGRNAAHRIERMYKEKVYKNPRYRGSDLLYQAMKLGYMAAARFILNLGAAVNVVKRRILLRARFHRTILQLALIHKDMELFKIILSRDSFVNDCGGEDGESALHTAVRLNQLEAVKLLLEHKSDIDSVDYYDRTPLLASIEAGTDSLPMLQLLCKYYPNLSLRIARCKVVGDEWRNPGGINVEGMDALLYATALSRTDTILYLLEHGADINTIDTFGRTVVMLAAIVGDENLCRIFLDRGCDVNKQSTSGKTALHYACAHHRHEIVKFLLANGSNYNANTSGWTPLHEVFTKVENYEKTFHVLLDYGVDVNAQFENSVTPLHRAIHLFSCNTYKPEYLELLLEYGADVNIPDCHHNSHLYTAAMYHYGDLFSFLICYGADVSQKCEGGTPLSAVCEFDKYRPFPRHNVIYRNAIKWKTLGLATIPDEDMTSIPPTALTDFVMYEQQCKSELDDISKFNPSLYKLLTKPINDIPHLAQHEIMDEIFCETMKDRFPLYQSIMTLRLRRVKFRFSLLQQCKHFRDWLEFSLPYYCVTLTLSYLSNRDLRRLSSW